MSAAKKLFEKAEREAGEKERLAKQRVSHRIRRIRVEALQRRHKDAILRVEKQATENIEELICPIRGCPDMGNTVNGVPYCWRCKHKLVPRSKLKNYNRSYRRKHLRSIGQT